ncbi:hypothetical protein [Clostridium neonatale]|uniref:Uncharacterized protein n=1 Tax=Clostridium neonatale TaxID=137838 RepID=A0AA86JWH4_9CLOT|nr:hypothetical protein CNEO_45264 [Clostridium neonatale]
MKKIIIFIIFTLTLIMNMSIALFWNPDIDNKKMIQCKALKYLVIQDLCAKLMM